ncbi:Armadillo-type fold containing protein [Parasponia andersonii]|uniref:Armadillo-type fold containing protein n=1 Tax=Parasponia andersonii TaxID=3476 RepID=A0A2P5CUM4_PARAD|nr:Armadillo-type fold containing protein [Parasponia andersonii]
MAVNESDATASLITSLRNSFRQVPPAAVPAVLDCVLASTGLSSSTLFASLIDISPDFDKDENNGDDLDSDQCSYLAFFVSALCHLLKKLGSDHDALKLFVWRSFLPLVKALHSFNRELLNQVAETFINVVVETNSWVVAEANLVPFLLRSVYHSLGMLQNEESEQVEHNFGPSYFSFSELDKERIGYPTWSLPLPISCYILTLMLDAALLNQQTAVTSESVVANGCLDAQHFADKCGDADISSDKVDGLDIRAEKEFWNEIKRGLVDKESLVRKQSLHMLKKAVCINGASQSSSVSEITLRKKYSVPQGKTKRELWAAMEAQSLGVGRMCNSIEPNLNSQQKWDAFVLLYEMLDEYGTHLVEAAWNHQVSLLLQSSTSHVGFVSSDKGGKHRNLIEISGEIFNWLAILWERGLQHDNPQVRCLIMQSILGIKWKDNGNCANSVPESFMLGSFLQALNDPVHHKEFGVKGVYSSRTIEGAAEFLHLYASCLSSRKWIVFLSGLASAAKQQSFSRAGMMGLAECIASAACRVRTHDNETEAEREEVTFAEMAQREFNLESIPQNDKIALLDALRFIIESSKQHFNPNYRLRVCEKVLEAGASVVCTFDVPLEILLHFISTLPREFTDYGGKNNL